MKKIINLFLGLFLTITLAACDGKISVISNPFVSTPQLELSTISEVLELDEGVSFRAFGVVSGYGRNGTNNSALIIEDPTNGRAIEAWTYMSSVKVGDEVIVSGTRTSEKGLPRMGDFVLEEIVSNGNPLHAPRVINDVNTWAEELLEDPLNYFGRYTFTADLLKAAGTGTYAYFTQGNNEDNKILQITIQQTHSVYKHDWVAGRNYTVVATMLGVSDDLGLLETKSIATRLGIMKSSDVTDNTGGTPIPEEPMTVTEVLEASQGADIKVEGTVIGFGVDGTKSSAIIIEDPANGNAIEMWAYFPDIEVGDSIVVTGNRSSEKGLPRIDNPKLVDITAKNTPLHPATEVSDLTAWSNSVLENPLNYLGRYTFRAIIVEGSLAGNYSYFTRGNNSDNKILQVAIYQGHSIYKHDWVVGNEYEVEVVTLGVSDTFTDISEKSIAMRLGIMKEAHVIDHGNPTPAPEEPVTVTEAIAAETGTSLKVKGTVIGFARNGTNNAAMAIEDPANGNAIEMWTYKPDLEVGDSVIVEGLRSEEKGYPRIAMSSYEVVEKNVPLYAPTPITDLSVWTSEIVADLNSYLGRYTFTATLVEGTVSSNYVYFTRGNNDDNKILQIAIHQANSLYKHEWVVGNEYQLTVVALGLSDSMSALETKSTSTRMYIMNASDVVDLGVPV